MGDLDEQTNRTKGAHRSHRTLRRVADCLVAGHITLRLVPGSSILNTNNGGVQPSLSSIVGGFRNFYCYLTNSIASSAAAMVFSITVSSCAVEMNPASNWDGARYTPCSSIAWK